MPRDSFETNPSPEGRTEAQGTGVNWVMWLVALVVAGLMLRVVWIGSKSYWVDELISIWHAQSIVDIRSFLALYQSDAHPPLYYGLLHLWLLGGPGAESYTRLLSVVISILTIPATYWLARQFCSPRTSLLAAALVTFSPFLLIYDREVRAYPLLAFVTVTSWAFLVLALRKGNWWYWTGYSVFVLASLYTHYHGFLVVIGQWSFVMLTSRHNLNAVFKFLASQVVVALLFVPLLPTFFQQFSNWSLIGAALRSTRATADFFARPLPFLQFPLVVFAFSVGQTLLPWNVFALVGCVAVGIILLFSVRVLLAAGSRHNRLTFFIAAALIPLTVGGFVSFVNPRYFNFLAPVYYILLAMGFVSLSHWKVKLALAALVCLTWSAAISNYYTERQFHVEGTIEPWREIGQFLKEHVGSTDVVVTISAVPLRYYYKPEVPVFIDNIVDNSIRTIETGVQLGAKTIWLVAANPAFADDADRLIKWLDSQFEKASVTKFHHDPDYELKTRLFRRRFPEYRVIVYEYRVGEVSPGSASGMPQGPLERTGVSR